MDINITVQGDRMEFIYNDDLVALLDEGDSTVRRVSHVEPSCVEGKHGWTADMSPVDGPMLGPYDTRAEALAAEVAWLQSRRGL
jgi:hypothetical protein